jgi:hypothetical protein
MSPIKNWTYPLFLVRSPVAVLIDAGNGAPGKVEYCRGAVAERVLRSHLIAGGIVKKRDALVERIDRRPNADF